MQCQGFVFGDTIKLGVFVVKRTGPNELDPVPLAMKTVTFEKPVKWRVHVFANPLDLAAPCLKV